MRENNFYITPMDKIIENSHYNNYISALEKKINNEVLTPDVADIIEVTYAYKELENWSNFNITLFCKLLWKDTDDTTIIINNIEKDTSNALKAKIEDIGSVILELWELNNLSAEELIKKELLISSLRYARNNIEIALIWLPFELEKAGFTLNMTNEQVEERVKKIEDLEAESFWGKISENPEEMELIYNFMISNFDDFKQNLTTEEQGEYIKYLNEVKLKLWDNFSYKKPKENPPIHPAMELQMWRDDYKKIFESIPKIMSSNKEVEVSDDYGSFYDWDKWYIPGNKDYENKNLLYILSTTVHEAFHLTTEMLWEENIWGVRWGGYLEREEGMAMYLEYLIKWERSLVGPWEPRLLVWELFSWKETEKFIKLHNKLNPNRKSWNILRNKRNYPLNYKWAQHKDTSYWRWLRQIHKIMNWENERNISKRSLVMWKMNFDFLEKHWDKYKANIPKKVLYPFVMAEMMKFYSVKYYDSKLEAANDSIYNWWEYKFNWVDFKEYMDKRYSSIDLEWLKIENNEFFIEKNESWKRIGWIINRTKKNIKKIIDSEFETKKVA